MIDETHLTDAFTNAFGAAPELVAHSPGRVNLIGEHTDYNDGFVFPAALDLGTTLLARRRDDDSLHTLARRTGGRDETSLTGLDPRAAPAWARYVRGVAAILRETGFTIPGADLLIDGDLPLGSGLSSSASLEMGVAVALLTLGGNSFDRKNLARLGQRVENEIIGVQSGIMDQLAVACGVAGHALLIDCRSFDTELVPIPTSVRVLVLDSAAPRTLAGSAYNQRRAECESALHRLQAVEPGLRALRDVTPELLAAEGGRLEPLELQRVRHVVSENARVQESAAALRAGDVGRFGALMVASHISLREDYAVSSPALDLLVDTALATPGVLGARLTGAGFGGCCVALVAAGQAEQAAATIAERYAAAAGRPGRAYVCTPSAGAHATHLPA